MAETYCGKSCAECAKKEELNCPGCRVGPGRQLGGDCELARCVRSKGHETCETCGFKGNCGTLLSRERMPIYRTRKIEAEKIRQESIARRAPVLGKWLWILFWLVIPDVIVGLLKLIPDLELAGEILQEVWVVVYGLILLKMGTEEDGYRKAGIYCLISSAAGVLLAVIPGTSEEIGWNLLISIPAAIVEMMGEYNEYMAHSEVLTGVNNELSEKWEKLWLWYIGLMMGMLGCILLTIIIPVLGALVILAISIGIVVVSILKLVYLYRTAKVFREYTQNLGNEGAAL